MLRSISVFRSINLLTALITVPVVIAPILFAISQSWKHGQDIEMTKVLSYARDAQHRTDATSDQIAIGIKRLVDARLTDPCSAQSQAMMQEIDLGSSYIQAIGRVSKNIFVCSSLGAIGSGWNLGPVDFVSSSGTAFRTNVVVPYAPKSVFTVVELHGFAAIIHKSLPIDVTAQEKDVSIAVFSLDNQRLLASKGKINAEWIRVFKEQKETTFFKDGYVISLVRSSKYRIGSLAALPVEYIDKSTWNLGVILVPIGIIAGIFLAYIVIYLAKIRASMPALIGAALKQKEYFLLYQPIVNLNTGAWVGAEALIRWKKQDGEMVSPWEFIPVAEEEGLIRKITKYVINLASTEAANLNLFQRYPSFHLAINLSAADLQSDNTIELLKHLKEETGANGHNIIVEATERGFMDANIAQKMIMAIRADGIGVAIDDFGTGYSSLSYLESFEIDYLKIDKSFVDKIGTDAPTSQVIIHIIKMAKELNLQMVAEGVETEAQATFLRDQGVQFAQGWLYGKPMSLRKITLNLDDKLKT